MEGTRRRLAALTADTNRRIRQHRTAQNPPTAAPNPTAPATPGTPPGASRGGRPPTGTARTV
ncbi:hypothetical protein GCM10027168_41420 [Streptomyces capparidis]